LLRTAQRTPLASVRRNTIRGHGDIAALIEPWRILWRQRRQDRSGAGKSGLGAAINAKEMTSESRRGAREIWLILQAIGAPSLKASEQRKLLIGKTSATDK
jgi:transposase-like protein